MLEKWGDGPIKGSFPSDDTKCQLMDQPGIERSEACFSQRLIE